MNATEERAPKPIGPAASKHQKVMEQAVKPDTILAPVLHIL